MGVDLTLLPVLGNGHWFSHQVIQLERRRDLWDQIAELRQQDVPEKLSCYLARTAEGETCYGDIDQDCYGDALKWTTPAELLKLKDYHEVQDNWQNKAVWAWLAEVPPDWPIVLYWH